MRKIILTALSGLVLSLTGCADEDKKPAVESTPELSLSERVKATGDVDVYIPDNVSPTEELLYLMGSPRTVKASIILTQDAMNAASLLTDPNFDMTETLRVQEMTLEELDGLMPSFISNVAKVYDGHFTTDEI